MSRLVFLFVLAAALPCEAGRHRAAKLQIVAGRIQLRQSRIDSGVALTRSRTRLYAAQAVANVTGVFMPFGIIANILGR